MGISTSTGTLIAGQSRTFNLSPASAVTLTLSPNVRVTITETPATVAATGLGGNASRVHEPRLPGTFTDILDATGATLRSGVRAGEPLLESALLPAEGGGLAQESLDRGFRAYPLPSSSVSFPAAELHAGSRVDIIAVPGDGAVPLLENIEVLCVHGIPSSGGDPSATAPACESACILLQVTSEEACRLASAQESGKVEVLLRSAGT